MNYPKNQPVAWRWRHTAEVYGEGCTPGPWNEGHPPPHTPGKAWRYQAQPLYATSPDVETLTSALTTQSDLVKRLEGERDAALARAEWLPIESAPKGSKAILLIGPYPTGSGWSDVYQGWREIGAGDRWARWPHDFKPSHWMPLPDPPST